MSEQTLSRIAGMTILVAALLGAAMTAVELVTSPYNPYVSLYALDGPVHLAKYVAMLTLLVALPAAYIEQRTTAGRLGLVGLVLVLAGLGLASTPYNVMEMSLAPSLSIAEANAEWEALWSEATLLGVMAGIGFLAVIIGVVSFAIASRRAGGAFRRAGNASLTGLGVGFASMFLSSLFPGVVPYGPTWILLGLAAYGVAVLRATPPIGDPVRRELASGREPASGRQPA